MQFSSLPPARHSPAARWAAVWVCGLCLWLPFYMRNSYMDLIDAKFALLTSFVLLGLVGIAASAVLSPHQFRPLPKRLSPGILWLPAWCLVYLLSWLLSDNRSAALWGLTGRHNGLVLFACCTAGYLLTRLFCPAGLYVGLCRLFTICGAVTALLGIANAWGLDPLGAYYCLLPGSGELYLSTLGNLNFFAAYLCLCLPLAIQSTFHAPGPRLRMGTACCCVIMLTGLLMASTDAAWLAFGVSIAVIFCDRRLTLHGAQILLGIFAGFCFAAFLTGLLQHVFPLRMPLRTISAFLSQPFVALPACVLLALGAVFYPRLKISPFRLARPLFGGILLLLVLLFAACNLFGLSLGPLNEVFQLRSGWASNRWDVWDILIKRYGKFSPLQKLVGIGADGVDGLLNPYYTQALTALNGDTFDSAHNEYLQHLVCGGLLGLLTWLGFLVCHLRLALRRYPFLTAALAGFAVQAFFSISTPMLLAPVCILAAFASMPAEYEPRALDRWYLTGGAILIFPALVVSWGLPAFAF